MSKEYCVCIRTLGKAGEKYDTLLKSISSQTIKPKQIFVYIPYGYELPKETIGVEQYIRCEKGMVHQRSLPFNEVDTEWMLFLDDDIYIPNDGIERLFKGIEAYGGDCISPDIYHIQDLPVKEKIKAALCLAFPRKDDGWAFKLRRNGSYTYNRRPSKDVLLSQSAAGACFLIKKEVYSALHFDRERWIDSFKYAIGEDLMLAYKIHLMGYRLLVHYNTGFVHLDAGSGHVDNPAEKYLLQQTICFVLWYRCFYNLKKTNKTEKCLAILSFMWRGLWDFVFGALTRLIKHRSPRFIRNFFKAYKDGVKYVRSESFKKLPYYDEF